MGMRLINRLLLIGALLVVSLGSVAFWAQQQTKQVPEFYERAIALPPPADVARASQQLESNVQQLQDEVTQPGNWQANFAAEQINAWLIEQLPQRFPLLQSRGLQEPRIVIEEGVLMAAARFKDSKIDAVLSCELSVQLTDQPNCLAVSINRIRAGALPLPVSQFKDRITSFFAKANIDLNWDTRNGDIVALIEIPSQYPNQTTGPTLDSFIIESIELTDQQLKVAGHTGDLYAANFAPQGPVYKLALLEPAPAELPSLTTSPHSESEPIDVSSH